MGGALHDENYAVSMWEILSHESIDRRDDDPPSSDDHDVDETSMNSFSEDQHGDHKINDHDVEHNSVNSTSRGGGLSPQDNTQGPFAGICSTYWPVFTPKKTSKLGRWLPGGVDVWNSFRKRFHGLLQSISIEKISATFFQYDMVKYTNALCDKIADGITHSLEMSTASIPVLGQIVAAAEHTLFLPSLVRATVYKTVEAMQNAENGHQHASQFKQAIKFIVRKIKTAFAEIARNVVKGVWHVLKRGLRIVLEDGGFLLRKFGRWFARQTATPTFIMKKKQSSERTDSKSNSADQQDSSNIASNQNQGEAFSPSSSSSTRASDQVEASSPSGASASSDVRMRAHGSSDVSTAASDQDSDDESLDEQKFHDTFQEQKDSWFSQSKKMVEVDEFQAKTFIDKFKVEETTEQLQVHQAGNNSSDLDGVPSGGVVTTQTRDEAASRLEEPPEEPSTQTLQDRVNGLRNNARNFVNNTIDSESLSRLSIIIAAPIIAAWQLETVDKIADVVEQLMNVIGSFLPGFSLFTLPVKGFCRAAATFFLFNAKTPLKRRIKNVLMNLYKEIGGIERHLVEEVGGRVKAEVQKLLPNLEKAVERGKAAVHAHLEEQKQRVHEKVEHVKEHKDHFMEEHPGIAHVADRILLHFPHWD